MLVTLKKDEFLSNQVNKQKFINLLSENLEHAGYSIRHAKGDAVMIVDTAITKARDQTTVLIGEDTDLLVLLLYHAEMDAKELFFRPEPRQRDMTVRKLWDMKKTKTVLGRNVTFKYFVCSRITRMRYYLESSWHWEGYCTEEG